MNLGKPSEKYEIEEFKAFFYKIIFLVVLSMVWFPFWQY